MSQHRSLPPSTESSSMSSQDKTKQRSVLTHHYIRRAQHLEKALASVKPQQSPRFEQSPRLEQSPHLSARSQFSPTQQSTKKHLRGLAPRPLEAAELKSPSQKSTTPLSSKTSQFGSFVSPRTNLSPISQMSTQSTSHQIMRPYRVPP
eukprot:gene1914-12914_t